MATTAGPVRVAAAVAAVVLAAITGPGRAGAAAPAAPYPTSQLAVASAAGAAWLAGRTAELARYEAYSGRGAHLGDAITAAVGEDRDFVGSYFCLQKWCSFVAIDFPPSLRMKRVGGSWKIAGVLDPYLYSGAYAAEDRTTECVATVKSNAWLRGSNSTRSSALRKLAEGKRVGVFQFDNTEGACKKSAVRRSISGGWAVVSFGHGKWWGYLKKSQISKPR